MTYSFLARRIKRKEGGERENSSESSHFSISHMPNVVGKNTMSHFQRQLRKAVFGHETTPHTRCTC